MPTIEAEAEFEADEPLLDAGGAVLEEKKAGSRECSRSLA